MSQPGRLPPPRSATTDEPNRPTPSTSIPILRYLRRARRKTDWAESSLRSGASLLRFEVIDEDEWQACLNGCSFGRRDEARGYLSVSCGLMRKAAEGGRRRMMDNRELRRIIEQVARAAEAAAPAMEQAARVAEAATRAMESSGVIDQAARAAEAVAPAMEQAVRAAEAAAPALEHAARAAEAATEAMESSGVIDQAARAAEALDRLIEHVARDAPAFNRAMDQLARNAVVFNRVMEQLARDAPAFNRVIEHRAREIANEATNRMDQGETEESAAQYVHEDTTAHAGRGRWVLRVLREKIIEMLVRDGAREVCELLLDLFK